MHKADLSQEEFEECFRYVMKRDTVLLQIPTSEMFTNQYNKHLFKLGMQTLILNIFYMHFHALCTCM